MQYSLDGHGSSRAQAQSESEAAAFAGQLDGNPTNDQDARAAEPPKADDACDWQGDAPEPELDDLAHECEINQQPSQPAEVCEWHGDEPEPQDDGLGEVCEADNQPAEPVESAETPVAEEPTTPEAAEDEQPEPEAGPSFQAEEPPVVEETHPPQETHSPWVDSLDKMPPRVAEKVNMGIKQAIEAAAGILKHPGAPTTVEEKSRRSSTHAPETVTPPTENANNKKQEKGNKRAERKALREARRKARRQRREEKRQRRREDKERRRKEKARRRVLRRGGGDIPHHLLEGLRRNSDSATYHTRCDICANSTLNSKRKNPQCTICARAAEREATNQYLKSSKISLSSLPTVSDFYEAVGNFLGTRAEASTAQDEQAKRDEELICHIALHVRDLANAHAEPSSSRHHKCNENGSCERSARHGLDRNRDSPTSASDGHTPASCSQDLELPTIPTPRDVDWWVRALRSEDSQSSARPSPPLSVAASSKFNMARPRRFQFGGKTNVYEPRMFRYSNLDTYSVPSRLDVSTAAYHFYLPVAVCHNFCCTPDPSTAPYNWLGHSFPPGSGPDFPDGLHPHHDIPAWTLGRAETLPSETLPLIQDEICHRRSRSGSI